MSIFSQLILLANRKGFIVKDYRKMGISRRRGLCNLEDKIIEIHGTISVIETILLAHEIGHIGQSSRYIPSLDEPDAWRKAKRILRKTTFKHWAAFNGAKEYALKRIKRTK